MKTTPLITLLLLLGTASSAVAKDGASLESPPRKMPLAAALPVVYSMAIGPALSVWGLQLMLLDGNPKYSADKDGRIDGRTTVNSRIAGPVLLAGGLALTVAGAVVFSDDPRYDTAITVMGIAST